ncbi:Crp/Fnr family transcriptional regulator [Ferrimonas senticii]|uniref:Crp/Fnr family transcriptional regulator n=1 Tax=Ferrimonas senticii TaxID=394566 RepID=UPI00042A8C17|nr:Crp/Fnr family transcriptional regulator [Ferrimonas senticii]
MINHQQIHWPIALSSAYQQQLLAVGQQSRAFPKNGDLPGDGTLYYIHRGLVALRVYTLCGRSVITMIRGEGEWLTTYSGPMALSIHVEPLTDCQLMSFSADKLDKLKQQQLEHYKLLHGISQSIQARWMQAQLIGCFSAQEQVAYLLLELGRHFPRYQVPLSQKRLSELTGIARQRVNETCRALVAAGAIDSQHSLITLKRLAPFNEILRHSDLSSHNPLLLLGQHIPQ